MIFYLSCTGNTKWAAKKIAEATNDKLVFIPEVMRQEGELEFNLAEGESLGFCFPVHGWRPPQIVRDFIRRLAINTNGHYVYALCTAGDDIGETMDILSHDLSEREITLNACCSLIMPESYLGLPFFQLDKPEKVKTKIEKATTILNDFIDAIKNGATASNLVRGNWPRINSRLLGSYFVKHLVTDKSFHVDSQKCVKCGICADVCPTKNIIGGLGYEPQWKHDGSCLACFACYHHCPHHAIDYGSLTKKKGQYFFERCATRFAKE